MSNVRQQFNAAKAAYGELKYPGNLAAEVMFKQSRASRWIVRAGAFSAMAAALLIALILNSRPDKTDFTGGGDGGLATTLNAPLTQQSTALARASFELPGIPQFPQGMSMVPSSPESIADMPGMSLIPSLSTIETEFQEPSPTTQEAL